MKKLLLLDADVVIDLHSLGLFGKMIKSYDLFVICQVFEEAKYYRKRNQKIPIKIKENALKNAGHHTKLYPSHLEMTYKACLKEGKALRIMLKKLI